MLKWKIALFSTVFFFVVHICGVVLASEAVSTVLQDTYRVPADSSSVQVIRSITLTNTQPDRYIDRYVLSFSNNQNMEDIHIREDGVEIPSTITREKDVLKITIPITKPAIGIDAVKKLEIIYKLRSSVDQFGLYREFIMSPSSWGSGDGIAAYTIRVESSPEIPLTIAKPRPTVSLKGAYEWDGKTIPKNTNMMVGLGSRARYETELFYELKNPYPYPVETTIPLPPDGAFQQSIIESLDPPAKSIAQDEFDNLIATYRLPPRETVHVTYKGIVELLPAIRPDVLAYQRSKYTSSQLSQYLSSDKYWHIDTPAQASTQKEIYDYVTDTLTYDDSRIENDLKRMGAKWALMNPNNAVCTEYTDLFIAQSRAKGHPARKVIGYAVERDSALQPVSFYGDILHAWPEYYDRAREVWHPIDPTWGDTARLDYFTSFDMNHIAFVYHGKDTEGPLPPGVHKSKESTKNVYVKPTTRELPISGEVRVNVPKRVVVSRQSPIAKVRVSSTFPSIQYVRIALSDASGNELGSAMSSIAPLSESDISIPLQRLASGKVSIVVDGEQKESSQFFIVWNWLYPFLQFFSYE